MTNSDVQRVLFYLAAAFPNAKLEEQTVLVWAEQMTGFAPDTAMRTARVWVAENKWFPSIAEFRDLYLGFARQAAQMSRPALAQGEDMPVTDPEVAKDNIRRIRTALTQVAKKA